jgi:hypothetical protein
VPTCQYQQFRLRPYGGFHGPEQFVIGEISSFERAHGTGRRARPAALTCIAVDLRPRDCEAKRIVRADIGAGFASGDTCTLSGARVGQV